LIGAASLGIIQVALTLAAVQVPIQQIFIGLLLLVAVTTDPNNLRAVISSIRTLRTGRGKVVEPATSNRSTSS
jgi:ribose transport system permease protein